MRGLATTAFALVAFALLSVNATAISGTPVTLTTVLTFVEDTACNHTSNSPCPAIGTFTANDETTASIICESGTIFETHWFTHGRRGPFTIANRTWTCPDGSTLVMNVQRWVFIPLPDGTAEILEKWVITGGTGRLAGLQGSGTMDEIWDLGVNFGGAVTGFVR
jgi:hypothetical protein